MAGWYDAVKDVMGVAEKVRNAELDLRLATLRMEGAKLAEENARLREESLALRQEADLRAAMKYGDNVYWQEREVGAVQGPFCPKCFDGAERAARMEQRDDDHYWRCSVCGHLVKRPGEDPRPPRAVPMFHRGQ